MPSPDAPRPAMGGETETTTTYRVQSRLVLRDHLPFPWRDASAELGTLEAGNKALASERRTGNARTEYRLVKITTEVCE